MTEDEMRIALKQYFGDQLNTLLDPVRKACSETLVQLEAAQVVFAEQARIDSESDS